MNADERKDFEAGIARLFGALDKPLGESKIEGFWNGLARMSLPQFNRACDQVLRELEEGDAPRNFSVGGLWAALRRTRAAAPDRTEGDDWQGDGWLIAGNRHLLRHFASHRIPGIPAGFGALQDRKRLTDKILDASPEYVANVRTYVDYKNAWVQDMRDECLQNGTVAKDFQRKCWDGCMARAEGDISRRST